MKILTIAVPAYNMAHYLARCLDSMNDVRLESMLEVIVVNDGSADGTEALAQQYANKSPEIFRVISQPNRGHGGAVNTALSAAEGKYFRVVDADDWVNTSALLALMRSMSEMDCDLFIDEKTEIHISTGAIRRYELPKKARYGEKQPFAVIRSAAYDEAMSMHTLTMRTRLLREIGLKLPEHTFYVDMQYVVSAAAFAQTVCLLRERVYNYQVGDANQSVYYLNYVRRYDQHDGVLRGCIDFCARNEAKLAPGRRPYLDHMLALWARSQMKIALICDSNRSRGRARAKTLRTELEKAHPAIWREVRIWYWLERLLNVAGVHQRQLEWLQRLRSRIGG